MPKKAADKKFQIQNNFVPVPQCNGWKICEKSQMLQRRIRESKMKKTVGSRKDERSPITILK